VRGHAKAGTAGSNRRRCSDRRPRARRQTFPLALGITVLATLSFSVASGSAATAHPFLETFGSLAQPTFSAPGPMAVDPSTGDLLVIEKGDNSVRRYNPDGTPANFTALGTNVIDGKGNGECATVPADCDETPANELSFFGFSETQVAVAPPGSAAGTAGDIYVTSANSVIYIFAPDGHYLGQIDKAGTSNFGESCGVTVDEEGAVYVGDYGASAVHKYVPTANPPTDTDNSANFSFEFPCALAAGQGPSAGSLFVYAYEEGAVKKISSVNGSLKYEVGSTSGILSVDPSTGHLYAAKAGGSPEVVEYDASGTSPVVEGAIALASNAQGVAIDGPSGHVFVDRAGDQHVSVYDTVPLPGVVTGAASNVAGDAMTLNGTVNPEGEALTECLFEYGTTTGYGETAPCAESQVSIGNGTSPVAVHADVSSLAAETTYHYRLVAANANGTSSGADQSAKTLSRPTVGEEWAVSAVGTEATVQAVINPGNAATTFHVEYGPDSSYGQSTPERPAGSDSADHTLTANLTGLTPGATYHWRVVASNEVGRGEGEDRIFTPIGPAVQNTDCANQAFRTGPAATLPDCRAYEMVSPVDKNNGDIITLINVTGYRTELNQSALSGDKFTYSSYKAFAGQPSSRYSNQYLATRDSAGWHTDPLNPPLGVVVSDPDFDIRSLEAQFSAFSPDLSSAWLYDNNRNTLTPNAVQENPNLYRRDNDTGSYEALTREPAGGGVPPQVMSFQFQGQSSDGTHQVFSAVANLTPDADATTGTLEDSSQLYDFSNGSLHLVSVLPNGEATTAMAGGAGVEFTPTNKGEANVSHAVSDDGSHIFFTAPSGIYVRVDGQTTVPVVTSGPRAWYQTASVDGSKVLYTQGHALYEFDVDTETRTLIAGQMAGLDFRGDSAVAGASEDLSYVYFVSKEDLASGATAGERNLYLDHEGTISLVAELSAIDLGELGAGNGESPSVAGWQATNHDSRVTPDGLRLAFMSNRSLTGYDNTDAETGDPLLEVYIYDADSGQIICASCNPSGQRPIGQRLRVAYWARDDAFYSGPVAAHLRAAAWLPTSEDSLHAPRAFSDDGERIFFNSYDALVPQDTNGVQDVYEWEAQGFGDCHTPGGCVSLISSGTSPTRSEFVEADPSGRNVFFRTESSLAPQDPGLFDIYDARVGGGFPAPAQPGPCVGDSCQSPPPPPANPTPASASFRGSGDQKARKKGRCVAQKRQRSKKASHRHTRKKARSCRRSNKKGRCVAQKRQRSKKASHRHTRKKARSCRRSNQGGKR
jgi:WD40 repeat protein